MAKFLLLLATAALCLDADDPWAKVKAVKSGSDLKIWKKGASQPVDAVFDELTDEKVLAIVKNEQVAIAKDDIDRIDARPSTKGGKTKVESTSGKGVVQSERAAAPPRSPRDDVSGAPTGSTSTSVSFSGKPGFETVYRRLPPPPPPRQQ